MNENLYKVNRNLEHETSAHESTLLLSRPIGQLFLALISISIVDTECQRFSFLRLTHAEFEQKCFDHFSAKINKKFSPAAKFSKLFFSAIFIIAIEFM